MNIKKYGAFMITKTALEFYTKPSYWFRDESMSNVDNGWRIIGQEDAEDFCQDPENWEIININDAIELCPYVIHFVDAPIGTDLFIDYDNHKVVTQIEDLANEKQIKLDKVEEYFNG